MDAPLLLGLDIGTSACKAGLVDPTGRIVALAGSPCEVSRPVPGHAEQDPSSYWEAAVHCIRQLLAAPGVSADRIAGVASCGHAPTMVLLDGSGAPVRPAILWQDTRAQAEAQELARDPGTDQLAEWMGLRWPVDASLPAARFRWLGRNEPEVLPRTRHVLLPKDYVHLRLTGEAATDVWSAKGLVHQQTLRPVTPLLELCGASAEIVPLAYQPGGVMGRVSEAGARETGLPAGIPVAAGWTDAMAAMFGTGALGQVGLGCDVSGTSEVIGLTHGERPGVLQGVLAAALLGSGRWMVYGPTQASGASLGWALRTLGFAEAHPQDALDAAAAVSAGAGGIIFLPYLQGERAPVWNPGARGAFIGLGADHDRAYLLRAVLEGVACSVRHVLNAAETACGAEAAEVRVAGGGARMRLWNQIKADMTRRVFRPCATSENGVLGAAMLAALAGGLFRDAAEAGQAMIQLEEPVLPDAGRGELYEQTYRRYVGLWPRISDL